MTEHSVVLLISFAVIAVMAILIYVVSRIHVICSTYVASCGQIAAVTAAYELRQTLNQILANTQRIEHSLHNQRRVLNDAHKRISAVTKGVEKPAR
jgi:hypothetical protein